MKSTKENPLNLRCFNLFTTLLDIINSNDDNDTNCVIAKFLLTHVNELDHMSIYDVAEQCYVSRSSVQRFLKFIGFDSFTNTKERLEEAKVHQLRYSTYADKDSFEDYFASRMVRMTNSINQMCVEQNIDHIVRKIHDSNNVVICAATNSGASAFDFQEGMLGMGKLIRVITSSTLNDGLLKELTAEDYLIVISSTGNFAIATIQDIQTVKASKLLITLNKEEMFKQIYDDIFYMNDKPYSSDHILVGIQNIFTKYGPSYLLDVIFSRYMKMYRPKSQDIE